MHISWVLFLGGREGRAGPMPLRGPGQLVIEQLNASVDAFPAVVQKDPLPAQRAHHGIVCPRITQEACVAEMPVIRSGHELVDHGLFLVCQVHISLSGLCFPSSFPSPVTRGRCEVRKRLGFTGCSYLASTRAALSSPPPAAFRPAVSHTAILAGAPSPGPTSFPLPCRRVLSRSQRLAACRARYLWGTSTGGG